MGRAVRIDRRGLSEWCGASGLVRLGSLLHDYAYPVGVLGTMRSLTAAEAERLRGEIAIVEERLTAMAYDKTKRELRVVLGLAGNEVLDPLVLRVVAFASFYAMSRGIGVPVHTVARAASMLDAAELLEARRAIREIIGQGEVLVYEEENLPMGDLRVGRKLIRLLNASGLDVIWTRESLKKEKDIFDRLIGQHAAEAKRQAAAKPAPPAPQPPPSPAGLPEDASARQIFARLRETCIGIDGPLRRFSVQARLHLARLAVIKAGRRPSVGPVVTLVLGASGSGKTWMATELVRHAGLPFALADMSCVSQASYVGLSVDDCLAPLLSGRRTPEEAQRGVAILDEFDKICSKGGCHGTLDTQGAGVQAELLRPLEGCKLQIGGRRSVEPSRGTIDTFETFFILAGAFEGLRQVILDMRRSGGGIGFSGKGAGAVRGDIADALVRYGFMAQVVNRIGAVIALPDPSVEQLSQIASHPNGLLARQNEFLSTMGLALRPTEDAVREMARWAVETKTYSRGVKSLLSNLSEAAVFDERKGEVGVALGDVRKVIEGLGTGEALS